jgi:hypothetical protein
VLTAALLGTDMWLGSFGELGPARPRNGKVADLVGSDQRSEGIIG